MTPLDYLWAGNLLLALLLTKQTLYLVRGRPSKTQEDRINELTAGQEILEKRTPLGRLEKAWSQTVTLVPQDRLLPPCVQTVGLLYRARPADIDILRKEIEPSVNAINDFAELVDQGLLRPKDFIRRMPALHLELLRELALIEPFIWYDCLICGRGRWGYRPLQLKRVLERLRAASLATKVSRSIDVNVGDEPRQILPALTIGIRIRARLLFKVASPTINSRSKRKQTATAKEISHNFAEAGYPISTLVHAPKPVEW